MRTLTIPQTAGLVAAACLTTVLLPSTVEAAGSALTRITDGKGPVAKVSPGGRLAVGDGDGPLTVDGRVGVSGSVAAVPAPAADPWMNVNGTTVSAADTQEILYAGVGEHPLNLTTFSVSASTASAVTLYALVLAGSPGDSCSNIGGGSFGAAERFTIVVPAGNTVVETFPSPMTLTDYALGQETFCLQVAGSGSGSWSAQILANGFVG